MTDLHDSAPNGAARLIAAAQEAEMTETHAYFTVEETALTIPKRGALAIYCGDEPRRNGDGTTSHSLRAPVLLMPPEMFSKPDETMAKIASVLNASAGEFFESARRAAPAADDLRAENERLRESLKQIAAAKYGLQGVMEDHHDTNAYNYHAKEYWAKLAQRYEATARAALRDAQPAAQRADADLRQPDYVYDPEEWDCTYPWATSCEMEESLMEGPGRGPIQRVCTLYSGPDKWVARVQLDTDGDGEADDWEYQWFDSEADARAALAAQAGGRE